MRKKKLAKHIERLMIEEELDLPDLESQHSRAYHTGVVDGLAKALFAIDPERARRNPISIVWFDEQYDEPKNMERYREVMFESSHSNLFESVEAQ